MQFLFPVKIFSSEANFSWIVFGVSLFFIGALLATWSLFLFHRVNTTTTPGEKSIQLITSGPYRFSRNPMYVSLTLAYLGEAIFLTQI